MKPEACDSCGHFFSSLKVIIITDQWCPDGERARALILVPSRVSPGFMSLRPGAECGSARLDSNSPSLLHPPFPYYHTHSSSSSHSHIEIDKRTCIHRKRQTHIHTQTHTAHSHRASFSATQSKGPLDHRRPLIKRAADHQRARYRKSTGDRTSSAIQGRNRGQGK